MRFPLKIGLIFAASWIACKMLALAINWSTNDIRFFVFVNMLFITTAASFSIYKEKRANPDNPLLQDIKNGLLSSLPYALIVSVFLYFYYEKIYPEFNENKLREIELRLEERKTIAELRSSNPDMENKTDVEIKKAVMENSRTIHSAKFTMILSTLALMIYGTLNSIAISLIFRRVIFRQ
jgi:hypothetical protein